jgi:hypothetical protein
MGMLIHYTTVEKIETCGYYENEAEGQTIKRFAIYTPTHVFPHDRICVVFSRAWIWRKVLKFQKYKYISDGQLCIAV